jgi:hypothetical protein
VTAAEAWAQADKDSRPRRRTLLEDALEREPSMVFHPLPDDEADS